MHYRCLLLPLLVVLSGCTTTTRTPDTPAASFVSTLITEHAEKSAHCRKTRFHNRHRHHAPRHHQPAQHSSTFPV